MILSDRDIPEPALMVWDGTEPTPTLGELEWQRAALDLRLRRLAANPDFMIVEGFQYQDRDRAIAARGELTDRLLTALEDLDERIRVARDA